MKISLSVLLGILAVLVVVGSVFGAAIKFDKPLPGATHGTLGVNQQLEIQKAAMQEMRTKMENWAAFTGYSSGTNR